MIVLHSGFDGLDVAFKCKPTPDLADLLERAKVQAVETQTNSLVEFGGIQLEVSPSGGPGGYAYRFDTGSLGATWFMKKPEVVPPFRTVSQLF